MGKKISAAVSVKFRSPSFIHEGKKYISAQVEAAAEAGDEDALELIAKLVKIGSGVLRAEPLETATTASATKAPKKSVSAKAPKKSEAAKAPKKSEAATGSETQEGGN